jgi:hypothetical protein
MDHTTPQLNLPYMAPAQAQKYVIFNEAMLAIDGLTQTQIVERNVNVPPSDPNAGAGYLIGEAPVDDWQSHAGDLAIFTEGGWRFHSPQEGWTLYDLATQTYRLFKAGEWVPLLDSTAAETTSQLGVNTQADATNRLSIKSDAILISHDDVTPGTGDVRVNLNRAGDAHTASLIFQNDYQGRAELGLSGGQDFALRVSADGTHWDDAFSVNAQTAQVTFSNPPPAATLVNLLSDGGRFAGISYLQSIYANNYVQPFYLSPTNGGVFEAGPKFISDNNDFGGGRGALDPVINELMTKWRDNSEPRFRRYGIEFFSLKVNAGTGTSSSVTHAGQTYYLGVSNATLPLPQHFSINLQVRALSKSVLFRDTPDYALFRDGVRQTSHTVIQPSDGWVQITRLSNFSDGQYTGYLPALLLAYCEVEAEFLLAGLSVTPGHLHMRPDYYYEVIGKL